MVIVVIDHAECWMRGGHRFSCNGFDGWTRERNEQIHFTKRLTLTPPIFRRGQILLVRVIVDRRLLTNGRRRGRRLDEHMRESASMKCVHRSRLLSPSYAWPCLDLPTRASRSRTISFTYGRNRRGWSFPWDWPIDWFGIRWYARCRSAWCR